MRPRPLRAPATATSAPQTTGARRGSTVDGAADRPIDATDRTMDGADRAIDGADRAIDGADRAIDGADRAIDGADRAIDGADRAIGSAIGSAIGGAIDTARRSTPSTTSRHGGALPPNPPATSRASRAAGTRLAAGVELARGVLVVDGHKAVERARVSRAGALALHRGVRRALESGAVDKLSAAQRASLVKSLVPLLRTPSFGRASLHDVALRSASFALLERVASGMKGANERRPRTALLDELGRAADREAHAGLRAHMHERLRAPSTSPALYAPPPAPALKGVLADADAAFGAKHDLLAAVSVVAREVPYADVADAVLRTFARKHRLPVGLSWPVVEKALRAGDADGQRALLERGMNLGFLEVNPARTTANFRRYVAGAVDELRKSDAQVAKVALAFVESGRVRVDTLDDVTRDDYVRIRRDYLKDGTALPKRFDPDDHKSRAWRAVTQDLNGYMWDDRIYVTAGQTPRGLAATLVHEVNHVINKSEEHYRGEQQVLIEEYRAFYSEALFEHDGKAPSAKECRAIKERVINDYGLSTMTVDDVSDVPPGRFEP